MPSETVSETRRFTIRLEGRDLIAGELLGNGWVRLDDRGSGLVGLCATNGRDSRGDLMRGGWGPYITEAVAEHFGYEPVSPRDTER